MPGTLTHLAVADRIYSILGDGTIKNLPLFFGGNIAPDAIHAKKDYQRADKRHSHLCDGIHLYGYGCPKMSLLFKGRINEFFKKYYMTAGEDRDLYWGYIVHLLVDEFYMFSVFNRLENHLKNSGANPYEPGLRQKLASELSDDPQKYNPAYTGFFSKTLSLIDISANNYDFKQNAVEILEAVWDYEVKDHISANEINTSKRWVIDNLFKSEEMKNLANSEIAVNWVDLAAKEIIGRLQFMLQSCL